MDLQGEQREAPQRRNEMKRKILIGMLSAAAMFAQSTPAAPQGSAPQGTTKSTTSTTKKTKKAKSTTAKQAVNKKAVPASSSAPVKQ
jgi:hypothetical protein